MHCENFRQQLQRIGVKGLREMVPGVLHTHLESCADCREYTEDMQFRQALSAIPVAGPGEGFAERALQRAWAARDGQRTAPSVNTGWLLATAATLVLAVGAAFMVPGTGVTTGSGSPLSVVEVAPQSVRQVDLLMVSGHALVDAWITVQMDENVSLAGYPDLDRIRWSTSIAQGNNQLTLPVQLRGNSSGSIVVEVEADGARKQMQLTVEAAPQMQQAGMLPINLFI
ncbi:MAG: hypothetical protein V4751_13515 [Pseudomonadota bacterium]